MPLSAAVQSEPFSTPKGVPLCSVSNPPTCQPPSLDRRSAWDQPLMPRRWARGKVFFLDAHAAGKARTGIHRCVAGVPVGDLYFEGLHSSPSLRLGGLPH